MTSAIQAATILAAMITTCFQGELCFFDHQHQTSPRPRPSTVSDVLQICQQIRASGGTSLAAALYPYYQSKTKIDRLVLVSDEEENSPSHGFMFAKLLRMYKDEVYDGVELIVICVNKGDEEFRRSLKRHGIECRQRLEIDGQRPDLSKFDSMLSQIALLSSRNQDPNGEDESMVDVRSFSEDCSTDDDFVVVEENDESW